MFLKLKRIDQDEEEWINMGLIASFTVANKLSACETWMYPNFDRVDSFGVEESTAYIAEALRVGSPR